MYDFIYVIATVAFFGLMLGYVRGCDRLGHAASADSRGGASTDEAKQ